MKNKFLITLSLCVQILSTSAEVCAAESSSSLDRASDQREKRLSIALKEIFDIDVSIKGDSLVFAGTQSQLSAATAKLGNFDQLRQFMIPVSTKTVSTKACPKPRFTCWQDCVEALGIPQAQLSNFAIKPEFDIDNSIQIPYDSHFNKTLADAYIKELKLGCTYFDWMSRHNPQLLSYNDIYLTIKYALLTDHFCTPALTQEPTNVAGRFTSSLSLGNVLNKLSAAAGSDISLAPTSQPGQYHVRTVMHGDQLSQNANSSGLTIEFGIDNSGSMSGYKINTVNSTMPTILTQFREALKEGESLPVNVFTFNNTIKLHQAYTLTHGTNSLIKWDNITADGGTDLTHVGNLLRLAAPNKPKIVIAFTDGEHHSTSDINESYSSLTSLQHDGVFAQPYFCQVGTPTPQSAGYFSKISSIFAGSFYHTDSIDTFIRDVTSSIPALLESNVPIILTLGGQDVTIRQPDAHPDILTTTQILKKGDSVLLKGIRQTVDVTPSVRIATATDVSVDARAPALTSAPTSTPLSESKTERKARLEREKARLLAELEALDLEDEVTTPTDTSK